MVSARLTGAEPRDEVFSVRRRVVAPSVNATSELVIPGMPMLSVLLSGPPSHPIEAWPTSYAAYPGTEPSSSLGAGASTPEITGTRS